MLGVGLVVAAAYISATIVSRMSLLSPRKLSRGLWNHRRTFVCLFVCLFVCYHDNEIKRRGRIWTKFFGKVPRGKSSYTRACSPGPQHDTQYPFDLRQIFLHVSYRVRSSHKATLIIRYVMYSRFMDDVDNSQ